MHVLFALTLLLLGTRSGPDSGLDAIVIRNDGALLGVRFQVPGSHKPMSVTLSGSGRFNEIVLPLARGLEISISGSGALSVRSRPASWRQSFFQGHIAGLKSRGFSYSFSYFQGKLGGITFREGSRTFAYKFSYFQGKLGRITFQEGRRTFAYKFSYFQGKLSKVLWRAGRRSWSLEFSYSQRHVARVQWHSGRARARAELSYLHWRVSKVRTQGAFPVPIRVTANRRL